jgi:tetrathionate reductase subunit B
MSETEKVEKAVGRKDFLKAVKAAGAGLLVLAVGKSVKTVEAASRKVKGPRYAMLVDLRRCIGCKTCTVACKAENEVPLGVFRTTVNSLETGKYPKTKRYFAPRLCNHCDNPPCVDPCPVDPIKTTYTRPDGIEVTFEKKATYKRPDGVVLMDYERCIGCHLCVGACPYGARFVDPYKIAGGAPPNNTVGKCDYCVHRLDKGMVPSCVQSCLGGALVFGDLNDSHSKASKMVRENKTQVWKPDENTKPQTYYIGLKENEVLGEEVQTHV